jgi:hypothetical protein
MQCISSTNSRWQLPQVRVTPTTEYNAIPSVLLIVGDNYLRYRWLQPPNIMQYLSSTNRRWQLPQVQVTPTNEYNAIPSVLQIVGDNYLRYGRLQPPNIMQYPERTSFSMVLNCCINFSCSDAGSLHMIASVAILSYILPAAPVHLLECLPLVGLVTSYR